MECDNDMPTPYELEPNTTVASTISYSQSVSRRWCHTHPRKIPLAKISAAKVDTVGFEVAFLLRIDCGCAKKRRNFFWQVGVQPMQWLAKENQKSPLSKRRESKTTQRWWSRFALCSMLNMIQNSIISFIFLPGTMRIIAEKQISKIILDLCIPN